jgi:hypothetical protein
MQEWLSGSLSSDDKRLALICRITRTRFKRDIALAIRPWLVERDDDHLVTPACRKHANKASEISPMSPKNPVREAAINVGF